MNEPAAVLERQRRGEFFPFQTGKHYTDSIQNLPKTNRLARNPTRAVRIGSVTIGGGRPIAVQSMCATYRPTSPPRWPRPMLWPRRGPAWCASRSIRRGSRGPGRDPPPDRGQSLGRSAGELPTGGQVAPWVDKIRYNPGHLYHHERERPWQDKVRFLAGVAARARLRHAGRRQLRLRRSGQARQFPPDDSLGPMLASALEHCELLDRLGFTRYCVSLKDSDPAKVIEVNSRFAAQRPDVPLHLGVTEAGMPPEGIIKTRVALEQLLARGIGDTIRVSLTVPNSRKHEEVGGGTADSGRHRRRPLPAVAAAAPPGAATSSVARVVRGWRTRRSSNWPSRSAK